MPLHPLGISRRRDMPCAPKQAAGAVNVRWGVAGELAYAFIDAPHQAVPPMLHVAALEAIHRRICVLPVRFGTAVSDEAEIRSLLETHNDELLTHLNRLDSTCEMGLRITLPSVPRSRNPDSSGSPLKKGTGPKPTGADAGENGGREGPVPLLQRAAEPQSPAAYLEKRRSHYRKIDGDTEQDGLVVQWFVESLHGCYREWRKLQPSPSHPIRLAFLVECDRVAAFQSRAEDARRACSEGRCVVVGPWPPYSFV